MIIIFPVGKLANESISWEYSQLAIVNMNFYMHLPTKHSPLTDDLFLCSFFFYALDVHDAH